MLARRIENNDTYTDVIIQGFDSVPGMASFLSDEAIKKQRDDIGSDSIGVRIFILFDIFTIRVWRLN